ncbi:hypothetical protein BCU68_12815 [Vibrio sp. 10N.286.49.B3]|nr:protein YgfX [Vibrio sp. 10N.286.49.B3]PMH43862.1 hypothetical protein BCU68_12815 [Vibrio sp. 10N.286.49.B3]
MVTLIFSLWAITLSSIPLLPSILLLLLLSQWLIVDKLPLEAVFFAEPLHGKVTFKTQQWLEYQQQRYRIHSLFLAFYRWAVVIQCENKQRFIIWRDSCSEQEYRHLLVVLRQHKASK